MNLKSPGSDPQSTAMPALFSCLACGADIEAWSDESGGRCPSCGTYFTRMRLPEGSPLTPDEKLQVLIQYARKSGAGDVVVLSTADMVIDDGLADRCREPRCENYGLSKSCPPHVPGPAALRNQLAHFHQAIFFKIDVPSEVLYSSERREVFQLLHEIASGIEDRAVDMGFADARAYAGGSCKKIFCHDYSHCRMISENGKCRHPQHARPSMSGFGINVAALFKTAGWTMSGTTQNPDATTTRTANVCGLVLIH
jgi:predicted metal-binding protein